MLKILCFREGFYASATWMHLKHPNTLSRNISCLAKFGYLKDLPEILLRLLDGPAATEAKIRDREERKHKMKAAKRKPEGWWKNPNSSWETTGRSVHPRRVRTVEKGYWARKGAAARQANLLGTLAPRHERIAADIARGKQLSEQAPFLRQQKRLELADRAIKRYQQDPIYRSLHDAISQLFADLLATDMKSLQKNDKNNSPTVSLAAKWCPSLDSSYDRSTLLCENIARRLFPRRSSDPEDEYKYVFRARERLRKEALVPLRKALELPEIFMSANRWSEINYKRVASVAMKTYEPFFLKQDSDRFQKFLADVKSGKSKIAAGALFPHDIITSALQMRGGEEIAVAELQWRRMVDDMQKRGTLSECMAVCDVSGSMSGTPMEVCIALGMLVSELCSEPWKGHVITFSGNPQIHVIEGQSLAERYNFTRSMEWGMNTDFQKVFDAILGMAVAARLPKEKMIKQLFVFSDMEFDQASANPWKTDYTVIKEKFAAAGHGNPPRIVFWNLRNSGSTPVAGDEDGVALLSGFSKNMLGLFLDGNCEEMKPLRVMMKALEDKRFDELVIVD